MHNISNGNMHLLPFVFYFKNSVTKGMYNTNIEMKEFLTRKGGDESYV